MQRRMIGRAATAALAVLLLATAVAQADTVPADGRDDLIGNQTLVELDDAAPGTVVTWPVTFLLTCSGLNHVAPGVTLQLAVSSTTVPLDGSVNATPTTIGPVPDSWTPAGQGCPSPAPTLAATAPSIVSLTMPTTPGEDYDFTISWSRLGGTGLTGITAITFRIDVNAPPTLLLPADITAEATSASGALVSWTATATDLEDPVPPTPSCLPASGSTFAIGPTIVDCTVVDGGGLEVSGSFVVTVGDSTRPTLTMPGTQSVTTGDPSGTTVSYPAPTAVDLVDPDPTIACTPASGEHFAVGTTRVDCTATDDAGNTEEGSFDVDVAWVDPVEWSAAWGEPVGGPGETLVANPGRTIPVKVEIFADGVEQTLGSGALTVVTCDGRPTAQLPLSWDGGRWVAHLDTSRLDGPGCYQVTAALDGHAIGSFGLDLRRDSPSADRAGDAATRSPRTPR